MRETRPTITRLALGAFVAASLATAAAPAYAQEPSETPIPSPLVSPEPSPFTTPPPPTPSPTPIRPAPTPALPQVPQINTLSPNHGPAAGGNELVIGHSNFGGAISVTVGGVNAPIIARTSVDEGEAGTKETSVTVTVPAGTAGTTVDVIIDNRRGSFGGVSLPTDKSKYTYDEAPPVYTPSYQYGVSGSAVLKTLTKGSVPLSGSAKAQVDVGAGTFSADLTLGQSTANLTTLGFLPVVAKVAFVPTESVKGTISDGTLKATAKLRVKIPSVTVLGLQLLGGANCQAKQITSIPLTSTVEFNPTRGGVLAGTFALSDLSGCGALTGLVSPLTAGSGNAVSLNLMGLAQPPFPPTPTPTPIRPTPLPSAVPAA